MQLKTQTDYAIRILLYLATQQRCVAGKELSAELGIAETYLPKIMYRLRQAQWVSSSAGITGGYKLERSPDTISLLDIMQLMEDTMKLNRCLQQDGFCSRNATETCPVHAVYEKVQERMEAYFKVICIEDVLNNEALNKI